ncbi:DNA methylase [Psychrobacter sp. P11G5]|nr:DNA methylase [Psychrobacter sp. P11G5]
MHSPNLVDDNVQKIMALFPNCITESKDESGNLKKAVDFDLLRQELSQSLVEGGQERYRLDWPGKRQAILEANSPIAKTLRPAREESVNFDTTENLFIEGDNLDALKLLQESYLGQVKMIYIDPPYNTGNDFIYEDDFAEDTTSFLERSEQVDEEGNRLVTNTESNGRFHSDWLTMMYSRLKLARNMLKDDGVIFISIDDNEKDNLKKICDEVFGNDNFIGTLSIENNPKGRKNSKFISVSSEYILVFAKDKKQSHFIENIPKNSKDMTKDKDGNFVHNSGKRVLVGENKFNPKVTNFNSDKNYSVYHHKNKEKTITKRELFGESDENLIKSGYQKYYSYDGNEIVENTYSLKKLIELFNNKALDFSNGKIYEKNFNDTIRIKSLVTNREYEAIIKGKKENFSLELTTTGAGSQVKSLFKTDKSIFNAPKNIGMLNLLITLLPEKDCLILDFFAGSSTTAHAILQLNAQDSGNRKFIMVQIPEILDIKNAGSSEAKKTIQNARFFCMSHNLPTNISEISKERIRRAGQKILADNKDKDGIENLDIGFRVLKIDSTNMKDVYYTPDEYLQADLGSLESHIKEDRTGEDLLFQVMLDWGVPLSLPIEVKKIQGSSVYYVGIDSLVACFDTLTTDLIDEISRDKPLKFVSSELAIAHDQDKTNIKARFAQLSPDTQVKFI